VFGRKGIKERQIAAAPRARYRQPREQHGRNPRGRRGPVGCAPTAGRRSRAPKTVPDGTGVVDGHDSHTNRGANGKRPSYPHGWWARSVEMHGRTRQSLPPPPPPAQSRIRTVVLIRQRHAADARRPEERDDADVPLEQGRGGDVCNCFARARQPRPRKGRGFRGGPVDDAVQGGAIPAAALEIANARHLRHARGGPAGGAVATTGVEEGHRRSGDGTRADGHGVGVNGRARGGGGHRPRGRNRGDDYNGGGGGGEPHRCAVGAHGGGRRGPVGAHPEETQRRTTGTTGRVAVEEARWWRREGVADPATGCLWDSVRLSLGQPAGCPAPFKLLRPQQAHVRGHAHRGGHRPTRQRTARRAWTQQQQPIRDGVGG